MKRILASILAVFLLVSLMAGCGAADTATAEPAAAEPTASQEPTATTAQPISNIIKSKPEGENWSIFVYLCGTDPRIGRRHGHRQFAGNAEREPNRKREDHHPDRRRQGVAKTTL